MQDIDKYVCLLDIVKAFPSTPNLENSVAMCALGIPRHLQTLINVTYASITQRYSDSRTKLSWVQKKNVTFPPPFSYWGMKLSMSSLGMSFRR